MSPEQVADQLQAPPLINGSVSPAMPPPPRQRPRPRLAWFVAGGSVLLVLAAIVAVILLSSGNAGARAVVTTSNRAYQQKVTGVLAPVVAANQTLSAALTALDGSSKANFAAQNATTAAQTAATAAKGALSALTVPPGSATLSQQALQALTQESGYLQAVGATLANPLGNTSASVQPLASNTSSAFVPLNSIVSGASNSISGVDNLLKWVYGAQQHPTPGGSTTTTTTTTVTTGPGGGTVVASFTPGDENPNDGFADQCDATMLVGPHSDCSVAQLVSADLSGGSVSGSSFVDTVTDNANEPVADGATITFECSLTGNYYHCASLHDPLDWFDFNA